MTGDSAENFRLSREDIEIFRGMNQAAWGEYVQNNRITPILQRKILTSLAVYRVNFETKNNVRPGKSGKDLLERFIGLQPSPDFIREEVHNARKFMLSRQSQTVGDQRQNYGLVVGRVQSGKTAHMIGLTLSCIEKQHLLQNRHIRGKSRTSVVILLSSLIDDIRKQTLERLVNRSLPSNRLNSILIGPPKEKDFATNTKFKKKFTKFLEQKDELHDTAIIVVKKNHHVLEHLEQVFDKISNPRNKIKGDVLIIDDECDYGTQDSNNADQNQSTSETSTNLNLRSLINTIRTKFRTRCWYVGYTATPYCNVLMSPNGRSSGMWNLFPRGFIYPLKRNQNHLSNEFYFGSQLGQQHVSSPGSIVYLENHDPSLVHLVLLHIITRVIKKNRFSSFHHTSMVNNATEQQDHLETLENIDSIITTLRGMVHNDEINTIKQHLINALHHYYSGNPQLIEIVDWVNNLTSSEFREEINDIQLVELNRRDAELNDEEVEICQYPQEIPYPDIAEGNNGKSYIATGGARISRGLTLEGLTISLFTRSAEEPNYDTMLQMSRWCGYRSGYEDIVKIMTTEIITEYFQHINEVEFQIKSQLHRLNENSDPALHPIWVRDHSSMNPTGKMPISEFIRRATLFVSGITKPVHWGQHPPDLVSNKSNIKLFNRLFNVFESKNQWSKKDEEGWNGYYIAKSQQSLRVEQFLEKYKDSVMALDEKTNQDRALINFINSIKSKYPVWNIAVSSPETDEKHTTPGTGVEINLSVRTPNSRGFIQQIYSNYRRSSTCDLHEGEERTVPLLLIYLTKTTTKHPDGGFYYEQRDSPSVQIGVLLPSVHTGGLAIDFVTNEMYENFTEPIYFEEDESE